MSYSDIYHPLASSSENSDASYSSSKDEMEVAITVPSPKKENRPHLEKTSTKIDWYGCSPGVFRPRLEKRTTFWPPSRSFNTQKLVTENSVSVTVYYYKF